MSKKIRIIIYILILIISLFIFVDLFRIYKSSDLLPPESSYAIDEDLNTDSNSSAFIYEEPSKSNEVSSDNITDNLVTTEALEPSNTGDNMNDFYMEDISDEIFNRIKGKSYKDDCTTPIEDLKYLHLLYNDFNNETCVGEMIVNKCIATDVLEIFEELYKAGYQIEKIKLVDEYDAIDEASMADNNSSAFNFRFISYTTTVSKHGLGMAIDINPLYNPYVKDVNGKTSVEPANAMEYVDRSLDFPHKIDTNDLAYKLFTEHGFTWGGSWTHSKDYQHFEKNK